MLSIQQSVAKIFAGLTASVLFAPASWAVSLTVNNQTLSVQTPTSAPSGILYVQSGADNSSLKVYTNGFLFCDNVYPDEQSPFDEVTLTPAHEDQSFSPSHPWAFSTAKDVQAVAFTGTSVLVNRSASGVLSTTLGCRGVGPSGELSSARSEGIFDNGLESATDANYTDLINWIAPQGFDWNEPVWSQVPTDPCNPSGAQPARIDETASCAAVSGARPGPVRAATMWTATDGITFTYAFRVDNRFGAQIPGAEPNFQVPAPDSVDVVDASTASKVAIVDAYDSSYLAPSGNYCLLSSLPSVLNTSACTGAVITALDPPGTLDYQFAVQPPPVGSGSSSFYVVVNRHIGQGSHPNLTTPVVAVAVVVDPVLVAEGGDRFIGDDVVFGFTPGATSGFPWMNGQ